MDWNPIPLEELWELISNNESPSLLKAVLTEDLYTKCKNKKTSLGGTLAHCMNTGCLHFRKKAGIYACDSEAYTVFADIFDEVIKKHHKVDRICHLNPYYGTEDEINALGNIDPDGKIVISTRVRVGRSHANYPFIPMCTEKDLIDMEKVTAETLRSLTGELGGKYFPLAELDDDTKKNLIANHYLYRYDNEVLRDAGVYKFWDKGRGIFLNADKTFLCWVNEEDHIRLISMEKGGDLAAVYRRLVSAIREMEKKLTFARKDGYGFLTFCSTNLGTTLRASALMSIPNVCKHPEFDNVLDKYNLQRRGTMGDGSVNINCVYDLSNKRRLGLTEYVAVKEMMTGVTAIRKWEEDLAARNK